MRSIMSAFCCGSDELDDERTETVISFLVETEK
jgi:hypothetical protein